MKQFPSSYTFPGNTKVHVRCMTDKWFEDAGYTEETCAFWDSDKAVIRLRKSRTSVLQVEDLLHELDHAWVDAREWLKTKLMENLTPSKEG